MNKEFVASNKSDILLINFGIACTNFFNQNIPHFIVAIS